MLTVHNLLKQHTIHSVELEPAIQSINQSIKQYAFNAAMSLAHGYKKFLNRQA